MIEIENIINALNFLIFKDANVVYKFYLKIVMRNERVLFMMRQSMRSNEITEEDILERLSNMFEELRDFITLYFKFVENPRVEDHFNLKLGLYAELHRNFNIDKRDIDIFYECFSSLMSPHLDELSKEVWDKHIEDLKIRMVEEFVQ